MRSRLMLLVWTLAVACGPKPHPLASQREALLGLDEPVAGAWPAEAALSLGAPAVARLSDAGSRALVGVIPPALEVPIPLIGAMTVAPNLEPPTIALRAGRACAACVSAEVDWRGRLVIVGKESEGNGFPWIAKSENTFSIQLAKVEGAPAVVLVAEREHPQRAEVVFEGLAGMIGRGVNGTIARQLKQALEEGALSQPILLMKLPGGDLSPLRGIRLKEDGGVLVEAAVTGLSHGQLGALPAPGDGWVAGVSAASVLGALQVQTAKMAPVRGYVVEPTALHFDPAGPRLSLRLWKAKRSGEHKFRDYLMDGALRVDEAGVLRGAPVSFEPVSGEGGWRGARWVERRVRRELDKLVIAVNGERSFELKESVITTRVIRVVGEGDRLVVYGSVDVEERANVE